MIIGIPKEVPIMKGLEEKRVALSPAGARELVDVGADVFVESGTDVVTTRADVHYVVTEFGVAYLHGKNLRERAEALIAVAHPDFREELYTAARDRKLLPEIFQLSEV